MKDDDYEQHVFVVHELKIQANLKLLTDIYAFMDNHDLVDFFERYSYRIKNVRFVKIRFYI